MHITILVTGTRGDVQPGIALGKGLQAAEYGVRLALSANFADLAAQHGLETHPVRADYSQLSELKSGHAFFKDDMMAHDLWDACQDTDVIISHVGLTVFAQSIAEKLQVPLIHLSYYPLLRTGAFPAGFIPPLPHWMPFGSSFNRLTYSLAEWGTWLLFRKSVNRFRQDVLHLPRQTARQLIAIYRQTPLLNAFSTHIVLRPADWGSHVHVTGYLFLDDNDWQPPDELSAFLASEPPPVYIGFGSMLGSDPQRITEIVLEALASCGQRGIIATGWGGLTHSDIGDTVFMIDAVPHDWLFPRVAAVVHHGGAGMTAAGLRAGKPTVICPFPGDDQHFWGRRIAALGLGPAPIRQKKLTADKLTQALRLAVHDPAIRQRAETIGHHIRAEDGIANAVEAIERILNIKKSS